ncbi:hypothetical protein [Acinetobacter bereziniae]|uniref:hypothetical protein n=1 Tax=Acinetobacter bereziniae TaxID=106648 RepID=UPI000C2CCFA7|nr:hypothetical protein [Acinetobacter bereziniae]ATZ63408.1 hypothetical protein BSR55_08640 [Acinetobacter bereziniae]
MELHSNIYYKHPNPNLMLKLDELFKAHRGDQDKFMTSAVEINPEMGYELAEDLLNTVDNVEFDLGPESIYAVDGYSIAHFVHGSSGDEFVEAIVLFLKSLLDEIDVRAWGCGDDDPWEFWFKFEEDELIREDDEPFNDPEEDEEIKSSIYTWWHAGLPEKIKEGFLNQE